MRLLKKNTMLFLSSLFLCSCSSSVITKTLYTDGLFKYRSAETKMKDEYSVSSGLFTTDINGGCSLSLIIDNKKESNKISITYEGKYYVTASDDKNGVVHFEDKPSVSGEEFDVLFEKDNYEITYENYYFMYFNFVNIGKICLVR